MNLNDVVSKGIDQLPEAQLLKSTLNDPKLFFDYTMRIYEYYTERFGLASSKTSPPLDEYRTHEAKHCGRYYRMYAWRNLSPELRQ